jgi:hypothetical protein
MVGGGKLGPSGTASYSDVELGSSNKGKILASFTAQRLSAL